MNRQKEYLINKQLKQIQSSIRLGNQVKLQLINQNGIKHNQEIEIVKRLIKEETDKKFTIELGLGIEFIVNMQSYSHQSRFQDINLVLKYRYITLTNLALTQEIIQLFGYIKRIQIDIQNIQMFQMGYKKFQNISKLICPLQNLQKLKINLDFQNEVRSSGYVTLGSTISKLKQLKKVEIIISSRYFKDFIKLNYLIQPLNKTLSLQVLKLNFYQLTYMDNSSLQCLESLFLSKLKIKIQTKIYQGNKYFDLLVKQIASFQNIKIIYLDIINIRILTDGLLNDLINYTNLSKNLKQLILQVFIEDRMNHQELTDGINKLIGTKIYLTLLLKFPKIYVDLTSIKPILISSQRIQHLEINSYLFSKDGQINISLLEFLEAQQGLKKFDLTSKIQYSFSDVVRLVNCLFKIKSIQNISIDLSDDENTVFSIHSIQDCKDEKIVFSDDIPDSKKESFNFRTSIFIYKCHGYLKNIDKLIQICQPIRITLIINQKYSQPKMNQNIYQESIDPLLKYNGQIEDLIIRIINYDENYKKNNFNSISIQQFIPLIRFIEQQMNLKSLNLQIDSRMVANHVISQFSNLISQLHSLESLKNIFYRIEKSPRKGTLQLAECTENNKNKYQTSIWIKQQGVYYYDVVGISFPKKVQYQNLSTTLKEIGQNFTQNIKSLKFFLCYSTSKIEGQDIWVVFNASIKNLLNLKNLQVEYKPDESNGKYEISENSMFNELDQLEKLKSFKLKICSEYFPKQTNIFKEIMVKCPNLLSRLSHLTLNIDYFQKDDSNYYNIISFINQLNNINKLSIILNSSVNVSSEELLKLEQNLIELNFLHSVELNLILNVDIGFSKLFQFSVGQLNKDRDLDFKFKLLNYQFWIYSIERGYQFTEKIALIYDKRYVLQMSGDFNLEDISHNSSLFNKVNKLVLKIEGKNDIKYFSCINQFYEINIMDQFTEISCNFDNKCCLELIEIFKNGINKMNKCKVLKFDHSQVSQNSEMINQSFRQVTLNAILIYFYNYLSNDNSTFKIIQKNCKRCVRVEKLDKFSLYD